MPGTALVTGATGFIGHHVAADLMAHGWGVRALVRPASLADRRWPAGAEPVEGDLRDPARGGVGRPRLRRRRSTWAPTTPCAAAPRARWSAPTSRGTANVVAAAAAAGARLVHTSSVSTVGVPRGGVGDEDTPLPRSQVIGAYKRSKVASERIVADAARAGQWAVIVNPSTPVGPGDWRPTPTGRVVLDFLRGRMPAVVDTGLNVVDVRDVAAGHRLALERGRRAGATSSATRT